MQGKKLDNILDKILEAGITSALAKAMEYVNSLKQNGGMLGIRSPHQILDSFTSGIIPGKVYTIAGYSNVGKSRFCYEYVNHFIAAGKTVAFFSLEVDKGMVFQNLVANKFRKPMTQVDWNLVDVMDWANLFIFDAVYKLDDIEAIITQLKPDIVFIDFVQNIQTTASSEYERMSHIARKVQEIAIVQNCSMICLSQLSNTVARDVSKGNTDFIALKGAGEFVASSDVIFLLRMVDTQMGLTIVKNKFGRKPKEIFFDVDFAISHFTMDNSVFSNNHGF